MGKNIGKALLVFIAFILAAVMSGCGLINSLPGDEPHASGDEIMLRIQLDLREDIGLLVIDHDVDGENGSGGISNADGSMIKRDEILYWTFDKQFFDSSADEVDLTLRFAVVTEYCNPNYDNIYPDELTVPMEEISFDAHFGESYDLKITGDRTNGYRCQLAE
ncbi:MAG: hypothetical protein J5933_00150 [Clostridia bacterium]|nr:hypothetical protein [Clostridia bacterium]